jgi:hypothetical protein
MDLQSIEKELDKRGVKFPPLGNQNQNTDETLILEEIKKRKGFEWMSEEDVIQAGKELIGKVTEPFKEYAAEEIEKGRQNWETEISKLDIDQDKMGSIETYLQSPAFKRLALEVTGGVVGSFLAPQLAGPVALSKAITIARPALQQLVTRMIGAGIGEGIGAGTSQAFDPRESVVKEVLRAATTGVAGEGLGAVVNKAIAKILAKNKKLIKGAEEAVETIAKQKEKIIATPSSYSARVQEAARTGNLTPALIQEGQTIDLLENVAELSLIGSGGIRYTREGAETLAQSSIDDFVKQFKVVADDVEMGNLFQKILQEDVDLFRVTSNVKYKAVDDALKNLNKVQAKLWDERAVDFVKMKEIAAKELDNLGLKTESADIRNFLKGILAYKNKMSFKQANSIRSDLLELTREFSTKGLGKKKQRISAIFSKEITDAMDNAKIPPTTQALYKDANKFYRDGAEVFNDKLFTKIIESDPEVVYKSIVAAGDRPTLIKKTFEIINKRITDPTKKANLINSIRGQFLEDAIKKSQKSISQYGPELDASRLSMFLNKKDMALGILFTKKQIADFNKFKSALAFSQGRLKKKGGLPGAIFIQMKQSGAIMQLAQLGAGGTAALTGSPIIAATIIFGPAGLAKAFTSPTIIRALTLGVKYNETPSVAGRYFYQAVTQMTKEGIISEEQRNEIRKDMKEGGYK